MTQISSGAAVFAIVMGISSPLVGVLFARFGARRTMLVSASLMVLALALYGIVALAERRLLRWREDVRSET